MTSAVLSISLEMMTTLSVLLSVMMLAQQHQSYIAKFDCELPTCKLFFMGAEQPLYIRPLNTYIFFLFLQQSMVISLISLPVAAALFVEYSLSSSDSSHGLRATLNPLCAEPLNELFVHGLFGVRQAPNGECVYLQSSTQRFTDFLCQKQKWCSSRLMQFVYLS